MAVQVWGAGLGVLIATSLLLTWLARKTAYMEDRVPDAGEAPPSWAMPLSQLLVRMLPDAVRHHETDRLMPRILMLHGPGDAGMRMRMHLAGKCFHAWLGFHVALLLLMLGNAQLPYGVLVPAGGLSLWMLSDQQLDRAYRRRRERMEREFPDFVSRIALLTGAGLHVRQALRRIVSTQDAGTSLLCLEVAAVLADLDGGMPEPQAWTEFSERCRIREISTLCGILIQHARQGGRGLSGELRHMASESWDVRKHAARRRGEEASSKLMIPVAILFIAVLVVSVAPAFMAMGGGI